MHLLMTFDGFLCRRIKPERGKESIPSPIWKPWKSRRECWPPIRWVAGNCMTLYWLCRSQRSLPTSLAIPTSGAGRRSWRRRTNGSRSWSRRTAGWRSSWGRGMCQAVLCPCFTCAVSRNVGGSGRTGQSGQGGFTGRDTRTATDKRAM